MAVSHVYSNTNADATGTVTIWNGATTSALSATNLVRPSDWNSAHNQYVTISGNTSGSSTMSGTNIVFGGTNGITLSASSAAGAATMWAMGWPHLSSYVNNTLISTQSQRFTQNTYSAALAFYLPKPISASFLRIPVLMTTNSTNVVTTANTNVSAEQYSTWNAVVYSLGTGASSKSLISVASGSAGFTFRNSASIGAASNNISITQAYSYAAEGVNTNFTTQTSASSTSVPFSSNSFTAFSSNRFVDINFANSLAPGAYWLVFGVSTSTATNVAGMTAATNSPISYSNHYGLSQPNLTWGVMGNTVFSTGGLMMAGSFSTAGGGTTSALPISAISSSASHVIPHFQLLRSA
jgi:hypothetical protein